MIIATKNKFEKVKNIFGHFKITDRIYIARMYGNKKLHPIGYHIPIIIFFKGLTDNN